MKEVFAEMNFMVMEFIDTVTNPHFKENGNLVKRMVMENL
jgi:hypothetical protein